MKKAAEYREHASKCRALAAQMEQTEHRDQLLEMASAWEAMAEQREAEIAQERSFDPAQ